MASPPKDSQRLPSRTAGAQFSTNHIGSSDARTAANNPPTLWGAAGELIYLGDTADSSLLQDIRRLARDVVGDCDFVNDPLQHDMPDLIPQGPAQWTTYLTQDGPLKPTLDEAKNLINTFLWVTTGFLDLFEKTDLMQPLEHWATVPTGCEQHRAQDTIYFFIFAIAAQADPADKESLADKYFAYGRYLVACHYSEQPSITAIQSYMLIAMYLLADARRNAAFMYTGVATRAAYALGLHRDDLAVPLPADQQIVRQRLWKVVCVLDGYISTHLGRKPASNHLCRPTINAPYSSCLALCQIFQEIVDEVYSERRASSDVLRKISDRQREWTTRLREGLEHDGIPFSEFIGTDDNRKLNLGLLFMKSGYYWSIILLSRPFMVEFTSSVATTSETSSLASLSSATANVMISACVASAINLIELFQKLGRLDRPPKRSPFVVNSVHAASLILALSVFLDFDRLLGVSQYLRAARSILILFSTHDPLADFNLNINESLQRFCSSYIGKREQISLERQERLVAERFGSLEEPGLFHVGAISVPLPEQESRSSDLLGRGFNFLPPENSTDSLLDAIQLSIGDPELEIATSTITSDLYDFLYPPNDTFF